MAVSVECQIGLALESALGIGGAHFWMGLDGTLRHKFEVWLWSFTPFSLVLPLSIHEQLYSNLAFCCDGPSNCQPIQNEKVLQY